MHKSIWHILLIWLFITLIHSQGVATETPVMNLDYLCHEALSNLNDIEPEVMKYANRYKHDVVTISSSFDIARLSKARTIYIITGHIDLEGKTVSIPDGCSLYFRKGSLMHNGTLIGTNTRIISSNQVIFPKGHTTYGGYLRGSKYSYVIHRQGSLIIGGTWSNREVGEMWTELVDGDAYECQSLSLNNLISLYSREIVAEVPKGRYFIYDWVRIFNRSVDFNGSELLSIDFNIVEDRTLAIPEGTIGISLRSRYGLIDFNAAGATLRNLIIDGRSSYRDEKPQLGSECLITIAGGSDCGLFENIVTRNAVDCDICTGAIKGFTFRNVTFGPCGEHGLYTHAYAGELLFDNCIFDSCGQSPDLFLQRGISGCVRGSASRDYSPTDYAGLRAVFNKCTFTNSGNINVATLYTDIPKADFNGCSWSGKVVGYIANNPAFNEAAGQLYEYNFYDCDNPCGKYNAKNAIRKLVNCINVRNPFEDTYWVENCDIIAGYDDVVNKYEGSFDCEVEKPVVFTNCRFSKHSIEGGIRNTIINPRPMVFKSCQWDIPILQSNKKGQSYIYITDSNGDVAKGRSISFQDCEFNMPPCRLLSCNETDISIVGSTYYDSYDVLIVGKKNLQNIITVSSLMNYSGKQVARNAILKK